MTPVIRTQDWLDAVSNQIGHLGDNVRDLFEAGHLTTAQFSLAMKTMHKARQSLRAVANRVEDARVAEEKERCWAHAFRTGE